MVILREFSEGSSTSIHEHTYDVFLSFRGTDTRKSFTDHLYNALVDAGITTFLNDEEIQTGEELKPELQNAIKTSTASIIILSQNYASSTWCLDELVLILDRHKNYNQIVIPVFYRVDPVDVRKQQSTFGDAIAKHEQRMEAEKNPKKRLQLHQKMELWKKALTEIANFRGMDTNGRLETDVIEGIIMDIKSRLGSPSVNSQPLIGIDYYIRFITSWLTDGSCHIADILTVFGVGGIGKTSLAEHVFKLHYHTFQKSSFLDGIGRRCTEEFNGLPDLRKQLYGDISKRKLLQVHDVSVYTPMIEDELTRKKVFLVLDDIDSLDQLDALLGNRGFYPGSKILITTRDGLLTERCALFNTQIQPKHTRVSLNGLNEISSLQLLSTCAFKHTAPKEGYIEVSKKLQLLSTYAFKHTAPKEGYIQVSKKLAKFCHGHPLALKVLGSSVCDRDVTEWEEYIEGLGKEADYHTRKVLKMSFDSLPSQNDKELFKHIACFFVGKDKEVTETILKACGFRTVLGIRNLLDRCLLTIGPRNKLMMHQLLQEMGRDVVREESPHKLWKRSRLWCHEESFKVLKQKKGKGNAKGILLDMRMLGKERLHGSLELETYTLSKMDNLMLLQLNFVQLNGPYTNFPKQLRWLCMHGFPLKFIPLDLPMENLVALDMSYSNFEYLDMSYSNMQRPGKRRKLIGSRSKEKVLLGSLKILNLSFCYKLYSLCGFSELPTLERLILTSCTGLIEISESIEQCNELILIDLTHCNKLKYIPIFTRELKKLISQSEVGDRGSLKMIHAGSKSDESSIEVISKDLKSLTILLPWSLVNTARSLLNKTSNKPVADGINSQTTSSTFTKAIPSGLKSLTISLVRLSLEGNNLSQESFLNDLSSLSMLKDLNLGGNALVSLPNSLKSLSRLQKLSLDMLESIEHPPSTLRQLIIESYSPSHNYKSLLRKIVFDPSMSPLELSLPLYLLAPSSIEIEGMVKIQPLAGVEQKIMHSLGWTNLKLVKRKRLGTYHLHRGSEESKIQMYYEFGIFSTIYGGTEIPHWISHRSKGPSLSFTLPSSPNKLRGLNICYLQKLIAPIRMFRFPYDGLFHLPLIIITNITKNHTWIYRHFIKSVSVDGYCLIFLSYWMFGMNEMEGGDQVCITVTEKDDQVTRECGVSLVYDDGKMEVADTLSYYKSWNHIIGGDLSAFQITTGEYILDSVRFMWYSNKISSYYHPFVADGACYKEHKVSFRAFSRRKSDMLLTSNPSLIT